ncbi:hypothetical protein HanPSC8_Chr10g0426071 [Helianthus annuus]|nr:hypothetical protein HanPSC8_Chr10g0426071 [Helianthus annuus]
MDVIRGVHRVFSSGFGFFGSGCSGFSLGKIDPITNPFKVRVSRVWVIRVRVSSGRVIQFSGLDVK